MTAPSDLGQQVGQKSGFPQASVWNQQHDACKPKSAARSPVIMCKASTVAQRQICGLAGLIYMPYYSNRLAPPLCSCRRLRGPALLRRRPKRKTNVHCVNCPSARQLARGIAHQPFWLPPLNCHDRQDEHDVEHRHAAAQTLLQLPAADFDADDGAKDHGQQEAGVEHQIRRSDPDAPEVRIARFDGAFDQPWNRQPNLTVT